MSNENSDTPHPVGESAALSRRLFLGATGALASVPILEVGSTLAQEAGASAAASAGLGLRRLGSLEVSSIGIGVQNMSHTYQTTIEPSGAQGAERGGRRHRDSRRKASRSGACLLWRGSAAGKLITRVAQYQEGKDNAEAQAWKYRT